MRKILLTALFLTAGCLEPTDDVANITKAIGLYTNPNQLALPEGALTQADNVVIRSPGVIEPRRGFYSDGAFGAGSDRANEIFFYNGGRVVQYGTSLAYTTNGTWNAVSGTYTPVDDTLLRMKFVEYGGNLYFNTALGLKYFTSISATPLAGGVPRSRDAAGGSLGGAPGATGSWLPKNAQVAYRYVLGYKDANGKVKLGVPSARIVVKNPNDVTVDLSRTANVVTATVTAGGTHDFAPNDQVTISPGGLGGGGSTFGTGPFTITAVTTTTFAYAEAAANDTLTAQTASSGTKYVTVPVQTPFGAGLTTSHFIRIYRSLYTLAAATDPGDECFLNYEAYLTAGQITAGGFTYTDKTPETALSTTPLYTNPNTGETLLQANFEPPIAKDIALWQERMWYANTQAKYRLSIRLLGTGSPDGVQANDTITLGSKAYTAKASPAANYEFGFTTSYLPSRNVNETAVSLVYEINRQSDSANQGTIRAFQQSGPGINPGQIDLEADYGAAQFSSTVSRAASWSPVMSSAVASSNDTAKNRVYFSKLQEPEAVPLLNYVDVGAANKEIYRIIPLQDRLFVFKEDAIYTISGNAPNLSVDLLDGATRLLAPDSAVVVNNQIYAMTNQGVVVVTAAGVQIISFPIENVLLSAQLGASFKRYTFGVGYDSERSYLLGLASSSGYSDYVYVYNYLTKAWTRWLRSEKCGRVDASTAGKLYFGAGASNVLKVERRGFGYADLADEQASIAVSNVAAGSTSGSYVLTTGSTSTLTVGDYYDESAGSGFGGVISAINSGTTFTVSGSSGPLDGLFAVHYKSYASTVEYAPQTGGDFHVSKQFSEFTGYFGKYNVYGAAAYGTFRTDLATTTTQAAIPSSNAAPYAAASSPTQMVVKRFLVPLEKQRGNAIWLGWSIREAYSAWSLYGYALEASGTSQRVAR